MLQFLPVVLLTDHCVLAHRSAMAQRSSLQKTTEKAFIGQVQEDSLPSILPPEQGPVADGEASSSGGTPDQKQLYFSKCIEFLLYGLATSMV